MNQKISFMGCGWKAENMRIGTPRQGVYQQGDTLDNYDDIEIDEIKED
jgi:hypothetical protein